MKKSIGACALAACAVALVLPMWLVAPAVQAADTGDKQEAIDNEDTSNNRGSVNSKIERLGRIKRFKVIDLRAVQRDGVLRVQATLENGRKSQDIVYRAKWLDKDGFSVWEDEAWKPLSLYDHQKQNLLFVAPTSKATDFRIQIQGERGHEKAHEKSSTH